ncbi:protein tyrosine/serine phosphatase [Amycolatopsis bartoniae]|uniref:Protein-tyrosine-phosphatase n=1 Tax=Amycolatopsis bartoniae TaxID=941986 RepID=A0A8H9J067_9PSEU|nr:tyrosine-protein phosphatase [Amycolatopsis bartoniae]MBB2935517.1 protein tyrosine/serine phosphatase [Amycolatopsis bartoniae]TVT03889.1 tyrosine-protein phosphatase [Amycolatopsis bartoniae]GHF76489.1 protein-tyrosine-phosphatase [Amycolatopsis bartoniae]
MPWLGLEGAANARDVGGLPASDGRVTAERTLLRSDNLQGLTPADVKLLVDDYDLRTVVDLRSTHEVESEGPGPLRAVERVRHVHLSVLPERGEATDAAADALFTRREKALARYPDDPMCALYLGYLEDRPESVVGALRTIAESPGAALVHCAAGKDRTGVVVALSLTVAGVEREAVVADYAASGTRIEGIMARLRASPTYAPDLEERDDDDRHRPRAATMEAFLTQVDERYRGALTWLAKNGFDDTDAQRLREKLLA